MTLEKTDQTRLAALVARENALSKMTADFQAQYETRAAAVTQDMRLFWQDIANKYGLDLSSVLYAANEDFSQVIPTQMRFPQAPPAAANG